MGFAFFKDTTEGWYWGDPPPPERVIPPEFYERKDYVPFDKNIPAADISAINAQQAVRNVSFVAWLAEVTDALEAVTIDFKYNVIYGAGSLYVVPVMAETRIGNFETVLSLFSYDLWTPGQAAEQLRRDAKKIV